MAILIKLSFLDDIIQKFKLEFIRGFVLLVQTMDEKIAETILYRLYSQGKWDNHGHTPIENATKGFPKHLRGEAKTTIEKLIKKGLLIESKHNYGEGISLNSTMLKDIEEIIGPSRNIGEKGKDLF